MNTNREIRQDELRGDVARRRTLSQHPGWRIVKTRYIDPTNPKRGVIHTIAPGAGA